MNGTMAVLSDTEILVRGAFKFYVQKLTKYIPRGDTELLDLGFFRSEVSRVRFSY